MTEATWTVKSLLDWTTEYFKKYNIEWPHLEAEILLSHALKVKRINLYTSFEQLADQNALEQFRSMIQRRIKKEPLAYITGVQSFMSLEFKVSPAVLIPRPETEKLVEVTIDLIKTQNFKTVVDLGTGCGVIAISLAKYYRDRVSTERLDRTAGPCPFWVTGVDFNFEAIELAKQNAQNLGVMDRCCFLHGNLFEPLPENALFDLIVSNPPYIPTREIDQLDSDVRDYEPKYALDGGMDGLDYFRKIIACAPKFLKPGGYLGFEVGAGQAVAVADLIKSQNLSIHQIYDDLQGLPRVVYAKRAD